MGALCVLSERPCVLPLPVYEEWQSILHGRHGATSDDPVHIGVMADLLGRRCSVKCHFLCSDRLGRSRKGPPCNLLLIRNPPFVQSRREGTKLALCFCKTAHCGVCVLRVHWGVPEVHIEQPSWPHGQRVCCLHKVPAATIASQSRLVWG